MTTLLEHLEPGALRGVRRRLGARDFFNLAGTCRALRQALAAPDGTLADEMQAPRRAWLAQQLAGLFDAARRAAEQGLVFNVTVRHKVPRFGLLDWSNLPKSAWQLRATNRVLPHRPVEYHWQGASCGFGYHTAVPALLALPLTHAVEVDCSVYGWVTGKAPRARQTTSEEIVLASTRPLRVARSVAFVMEDLQYSSRRVARARPAYHTHQTLDEVAAGALWQQARRFVPIPGDLRDASMPPPEVMTRFLGYVVRFGEAVRDVAAAPM